MHTDYYVNGKKSDLSGYLSAADENEYRERAFKKAKKYYQENPQEWARLCSYASKETIGIMMLLDYEQTEEGKQFREEWMTNREKRLHQQAGCGFFFYLAIILGCIITVICMAVSK